LGAPEGEGTIDYQNISWWRCLRRLADSQPRQSRPHRRQVRCNSCPGRTGAGHQQPVVPAMQQMAAGQARDEARQAQVSKLMQEALKTTSPRRKRIFMRRSWRWTRQCQRRHRLQRSSTKDRTDKSTETERDRRGGQTKADRRAEGGHARAVIGRWPGGISRG